MSSRHRTLDAIVGYDPADLPTQDSIGKLPEKSYASFIDAKGLVGARIGVLREMVPFGIQFLGRKFSEPTLIKLASSFEAATKHRKAPTSTPALPGEKFDY